jgi:hypothetical protein
MTYDQVDAEDRGRPPGSAQGDPAGSGPASATRTDLPVAARTDPPKQTEFRLVSGTGAPESPDDDDGPAATVPQPITGVPRQPGRPPADDDVPLLSGMEELRAGWQRVKASFVDNPRGAVAAAAGLTDEAAEALAASIRERRQRIRASWDSEATARDTEALRVALLGYQALFDRMTGER